MRVEAHLEARFCAFVAIACLFYLVIEAVYAVRLPFAMDEFQGAWTLHHFEEGLPYRDFRPYKTVLGYYLQLPALSLAPSVWGGLVSVRIWMALLNAAVFAVVALRLGRLYRRSAVALALGLLVTMSTLLERSAVVRVDMMTSLCGLLALVFLLEGRLVRAGALVGASFLVSQKGIYFLLAANLALASHALVLRPLRETARRLLAFNLPALALLAAYVAIWSAVASFDALWSATVSARSDIAFRHLYQIHHFWAQTILRNPYFYGVSVLALGVLWSRRRADSSGERDRILGVYGAALLGLCLWHKQPWPYFFVLLIPTLFVLATAFFDAEVERTRSHGRPLGAVFLSVYLVAGLLFPLGRLAKTLPRDSGFQRATVERVEALLEDGETYLAGVNLVHTRRQPLPELAWLDARRLGWLGSLDEEGVQSLVGRLAEAPPKLVVDNYRVRSLPAPILRWLTAHYEPLEGNLRIYSPVVPPTAEHFPVRFDGTYLVQAGAGSDVVIDGRRLSPGERIRLSAGVHTNGSRGAARLRYLTGSEPNGDGRYRESRPLFPDVYGY
jgi:hypothetical protein